MPTIWKRMSPAICRFAMPSAKLRWAASRSPLVQYASPRSAAAAPRHKWSSSGKRSSARRAWFTVPGTSPRAPACRHGRWRSFPAETETPLRPRRPSRPMELPVAHSCLPSCPATVRRPAGGPRRPPARCDPRRQGVVHAEHGPGADQLVRQRLQPAKQRRLLTTAEHCRAASSTRSAARSKSSAASAWRIASAGRPLCSYHSLARRCRSGT